MNNPFIAWTLTWLAAIAGALALYAWAVVLPG